MAARNTTPPPVSKVGREVRLVLRGEGYDDIVTLHDLVDFVGQVQALTNQADLSTIKVSLEGGVVVYNAEYNPDA